MPTSNASNSASQLASEIARESLFLPERERVWLVEQLRRDLSAVDQEQYETDLVNRRMSEAVNALERVADSLGLEGNQARLNLTMREFDAAPEDTRQGWSARRVANAVRGSWNLAKAIAFNGERLPVVAERQWKYRGQLGRKRREGRFSLTCIHEWLESKPEKKTMAAYDQWRKTENKQRKPGEKAAIGHRTIRQRWGKCSWAEIIQAVEQERLPGESPESNGEVEQANARQADSSPPPVKQASRGESRPLLLDHQFRARKFREAREARGWTIAELSQRTGIEPSTLGRIERGDVLNPSFERVAKIAHALEISLNDLVTDDSIPTA